RLRSVPLFPYTTLFRSCGGIRLSNKDMGLLLQAIALLATTELPPMVCRIAKPSKTVAILSPVDEGYSEPDPPTGMKAGWHLEPRSEEHTSELQSPYDLV